MPKVIIYSTPACGFCKMAEEYMRSKGIEYEKIDVAADRDALQHMVDATKQFGVPVIEIDGSFLVGWNPREFNDTYGGREERTDESAGDTTS